MLRSLSQSLPQDNRIRSQKSVTGHEDQLRKRATVKGSLSNQTACVESKADGHSRLRSAAAKLHQSRICLGIRLEERDREANNVRHSLGPQREAVVPRRSNHRKEPLLQAESPQAAKQSGYKVGSHPKPTASFQNWSCRPALKIPNAYEPFVREHERGCVNECAWCSNENVALPRHLTE